MMHKSRRRISIRSLSLLCGGVALVVGVMSVPMWLGIRAEHELDALPAVLPTAPVPFILSVFDTDTDIDSSGTESEESLATAPQEDIATDPQHGSALAEARTALAESYPGLQEEVALSSEEVGRLIDYLAQDQLRMNEIYKLTASDGGIPADPAVLEDTGRRLQEMQAKQEETLRIMLGGNRYLQWQEYHQTRGARQHVVQLARTLEGVGAQLTPEQVRSLTAAHIAEQNRRSELMPHLATDARQAEAERNQRILEDVEPDLTAPQLEGLRALLVPKQNH